MTVLNSNEHRRNILLVPGWYLYCTEGQERQQQGEDGREDEGEEGAASGDAD